MFALEVTEELEAWPEQGDRSRKWVCDYFTVIVLIYCMLQACLNFLLPPQLNTNDAFELCRYEWMREALTEFLKIMADFHKEEVFLGAMTENRIEKEKTDGASDVAECANIIPSNYYISSPNNHRAILVPWQITYKRLPLT